MVLCFPFSPPPPFQCLPHLCHVHPLCSIVCPPRSPASCIVWGTLYAYTLAHSSASQQRAYLRDSSRQTRHTLSHMPVQLRPACEQPHSHHARICNTSPHHTITSPQPCLPACSLHTATSHIDFMPHTVSPLPAYTHFAHDVSAMMVL